MYVGYFVFTREDCGEVVCIGHEFDGLDDQAQVPHNASFRSNLVNWLNRADIDKGQVKLFRGIYNPRNVQQFCGSVIDCDIIERQ